MAKEDVPPPPGPAPDDWIEIAVEVAGIDAELTADVLRQGCPGGVAIEPALRPGGDWEGYAVDGDAPALVKGYLPPGREAAGLRRSLRLALAFAPLQSPPRWRRPRRLPARAWRDAWKRHFRPQRIGRTLVIKPPWSSHAPRPGQTVIEIDPGLAFGTGQHPTTAMCLRALEEMVRPGMRVLDLGTGSGILAIAAARLGAGRVLALDVDPQAVKAARENARANSVEDVLEVEKGSLPGPHLGQQPFDLIVANISGPTLERLVPAIAAAIRPGGEAILSGFLEETVAGLRQVLESWGLIPDRVLADGVWRTIIAHKP